MHADVSVPSPVWGFAGVVVGGAVALWQAHRASESDRRKTSGSVESSDAKLVFDVQQGALVMSEQMRHDLRDQVERCQVEIQQLKDENDALDAQLKTQAKENARAIDEYRRRIEALDDELFDMSERLKREERGADERPANPPGNG